MKYTLSTSEAADKLLADTNANWTYSGARALIEYLEECELSSGEEFELDVVAIRCDYSEYKDLQDWNNDYFGHGQSDLSEDDEIRDYILENGTLIEFDGGIIVSSF